MTDTPAGSGEAEASLARLGLDTASAEQALVALGVWETGPTSGTQPLLDALSASANPDLALVGIRRIAERQPAVWQRLIVHRETLERAAVVAGAGEGLGDVLASVEGAVDLLASDLEPWSAERVTAAAAAALVSAPSAAEALAVVRRLGTVRVAARDLLGMADTPATAAELSDLADGVLEAALLHVRDDLGTDVRVTVIAMGKLGGRELNYVSDVDVMFVHEGDWQTATRCAERFLRLLGEVTPDGRVYEVDANLRPEGRDGPLVRSLDAYRTYYDRWAKTWEYQALLKARPVAGDSGLGRRFLGLAAPHVWPDRRTGESVAEIQRMKTVVEASRDVVEAGSRQVKLGPGGLRDIEFAVQLLQLVHGRHDPSLRSPNTLQALAALAEGGYVDDGDATLFRDAYEFLRTVEHRLQLRRLRRTHVVPSDAADRRRLARACGFRDQRNADALEQFDRELTRVQGYVRRLHEKLFYRPLLDRFAELSASEHLAAADGGLDEESARERLVALGFGDPERALGHLAALASGVSRHARLLRTLLPAMLPTLAASPDPDGGLGAFRSLTERLATAPFFLRTLRDTPPVAELLAEVMGQSRIVGEWLERQPEVFAQLADLTGLDEPLAAEDYRRLADGLLRRGTDAESSADSLRRLKRREVARIAVRDLTGRADVSSVGAELTGVAEACLEAAVALATEDTEIRLAVLAMGKLGGCELGYASDLDVLLVFDDADHREAGKAAERLMQLLGGITPEGQAFQVDLNLRPEGKDGPLARTLESYAAYYGRWAQAWEFQALTQVRPVAGDAELGARFCDVVTELVYPDPAPRERLQAVRTMKARVERERAAGGAGVRRAAHRRPGARKGDRLDLKLGPGGMSDVEWTVQLLMLQLGGARPALRRPGTLAALGAAEAEGALDGLQAAWLRAGWELLARVRNALYLSGSRTPHLLPPGPRDQDRLAHMLGYERPGGQALVEDLGRVMRRVRKVHERVFYG